MKNTKHLAASLLLVLALAGCAGEQATKPGAEGEQGGAGAQTAPGLTRGELEEAGGGVGVESLEHTAQG